MNDQDQQKPKSWGSSLFSLLLFLVLIAGRPLFNLLNQVLNSLNLAWINLLPVAVGAVLIGTVVVAVVRAFGSGGSRSPSTIYSQPAQLELPRSTPMAPNTPRFEPVFSPMVILVGVVGVVALVVLAAVVLLQGVL